MMGPRMRVIRGDRLRRHDRAWVLATFTDRHTRDHEPEWRRYLERTGRHVPPIQVSDAEWLRQTWFFTLGDGRTVDRRFTTVYRANVEIVRRREIAA